MNHTSLTPDDKEFWDFSFQEMGEIDLPAMVDYVLKVRFASSDIFLSLDWRIPGLNFLQSYQI